MKAGYLVRYPSMTLNCMCYSPACSQCKTRWMSRRRMPWSIMSGLFVCTKTVLKDNVGDELYISEFGLRFLWDSGRLRLWVWGFFKYNQRIYSLIVLRTSFFFLSLCLSLSHKHTGIHIHISLCRPTNLPSPCSAIIRTCCRKQFFFLSISDNLITFLLVSTPCQSGLMVVNLECPSPLIGPP